MTTPFEDAAQGEEIEGEETEGEETEGEDESGADYSGSRTGSPFRDGRRKELPFSLVFGAPGSLPLTVEPDDPFFHVDTLVITSNGSTCTMSGATIGTTPVFAANDSVDLSGYAPTAGLGLDGNFPTSKAMRPGAKFKATVANSAGTTLRGKFIGWSSQSGGTKAAKPRGKRAVRVRGRR